MASTPSNNTGSDEIDLGQLLHLIRRIWNRVFRSFLRLFLYLKKNALILLGLIVVGAAIGYGLNQIGEKKIKTEVIVKPQLESKNYLYDVITEIQANIKAKNFEFFKNIGITTDRLRDFRVTISPVENNAENSTDDSKYLELLQNFEATGAISDIIRAELKNKTTFNQRLTFYYKDQQQGVVFAEKIVEYINTNAYFDTLIETHRVNAQNRIDGNKILLRQADDLITGYSKNLSKQGASIGNERIVVDNQEPIDISRLFSIKSELMSEIEAKQVELQQRTDPIKVINFGNPQEVSKPFFGKNIVLIPIVLLGLYFLASILKYVDRKAKEL